MGCILFVYIICIYSSKYSTKSGFKRLRIHFIRKLFVVLMHMYLYSAAACILVLHTFLRWREILSPCSHGVTQPWLVLQSIPRLPLLNIWPRRKFVRNVSGFFFRILLKASTNTNTASYMRAAWACEHESHVAQATLCLWRKKNLVILTLIWPSFQKYRWT